MNKVTFKTNAEVTEINQATIAAINTMGTAAVNMVNNQLEFILDALTKLNSMPGFELSSIDTSLVAWDHAKCDLSATKEIGIITGSPIANATASSSRMIRALRALSHECVKITDSREAALDLITEVASHDSIMSAVASMASLADILPDASSPD